MNYAVAFLGLIIVASVVDWLLRGRKYYKGPVDETQRQEETASSDRNSQGDEAYADKKYTPTL
jgi:hypothetical protein